MKNINVSSLTNENPQSYVEFQIMNWTNEYVLKSLNNPETSEEAANYVKRLLKKKTKYVNNIPFDDEIIYKIIAEAFLNNKKIQDQLSIFYQQNSPKIAKTRVEVGSVVALYAYNAYKPVNNIDYEKENVA